MKREFADLRYIKDIVKSEFKTKYIEDSTFKGYITLVNIKEVAKSWRVDTEKRCILDKGYNWFAMYPVDKNFSITAMYDENYEIKEWYFDICKQNGIEDGIPFEDDLYLDVVIVPDGRINILDEDELLDAEKNGLITAQDVELAYKTKGEIIKTFGNNIKELEKLTNKYLTLIKEKMVRKNIDMERI